MHSTMLDSDRKGSSWEGVVAELHCSASYMTCPSVFVLSYRLARFLLRLTSPRTSSAYSLR
jgi:hypothetical protein